MKTAYDEQALHHLMLLKETKSWWRHHLIADEQWQAIQKAYGSPLYHPNFGIRILLFILTLIALSGITGFYFLLFSETGESGLAFASVIYGVGSFFAMKIFFIERSHHFQSGVTEALLYHSCGFTLGGLITLFEPGVVTILVICLLLFSFCTYRYLDLLCALAAMGSLAGLIFYALYESGGLFQQIIPIVFLIVFTPLYFVIRRWRKQDILWPWQNPLLLLESCCLLLMYASGNYFVVRELSTNLMDLTLQENEDIPFAFLFYALTVLIPVAYLYFGIKRRDVVLLRVSLLAIALSVFTFKYYYSLGHPEITLTLAGAILLLVTVWLFNYLKIIRGGFTREKLLSEKWNNINLGAFVVSQTLGGNQPGTESQFHGGGGKFGGGGSSGEF